MLSIPHQDLYFPMYGNHTYTPCFYFVTIKTNWIIYDKIVFKIINAGSLLPKTNLYIKLIKDQIHI
jgi:hypothetical protein